jgi:Ala-tRNA(Pro) deacylase
MLVLPASAVLDTAKASEVFGGRPVRLAAEPEFAARFPDCEPGAMPPFGNLYDLPVFVDRALGANDRVVFQAGTHAVTMSVPYGDFERLAEATVAELAVTR